MSQMSSNPSGARRVLKRKGGASFSRSKRYRKPYGPKGFRFPRFLGDQPARKFATLKYCDTVFCSSIPAATLMSYEFRANGMYDPRVAVGGHQPYGFDQLMAQYYHYTVIKSTCVVEAQSSLQNSNQIWKIMTYNDAGTAQALYTAGGRNAIDEYPLISHSLLMTSYEHKGQNRSTRAYCDLTKVSGKTASGLIADKDYSGDVGHDPDDQSYFCLIGYSADDALENHGSLWLVTIYYNVVFTEPRYMTPS